MPNDNTALPLSKIHLPSVVRTSADLGAAVRLQRQHLGLKQDDVAGLGNTGTRFVGDLENGKPTIQLQKALDLLELLGLEVVVQAKSGRLS
jgi:y4mF family transcriptional regulator